MRSHLGPGGEVQGVDLGRDPLLGLLDVQDVARRGRSVRSPGPPTRVKPRSQLALDEQVLGEDDALGRDLADEADEALLEVVGELRP